MIDNGTSLQFDIEESYKLLLALSEMHDLNNVIIWNRIEFIEVTSNKYKLHHIKKLYSYVSGNSSSTQNKSNKGA